MRNAILAIFAVALVAVGIATLKPMAVEVTVVNSGTTAMREIEVLLKGRSYSVGDLEPGKTAVAKVVPTGETGVALAYRDSNGKAVRTEPMGYFEQEQRGRVRFEVDGLKPDALVFQQ